MPEADLLRQIELYRALLRRISLQRPGDRHRADEHGRSSPTALR